MQNRLRRLVCLSTGSNVVGNTFLHGDMLHADEMLHCYTAQRGLGHGDPEDHRNVEQTTPLLGYRHRRACTETVDDGVAAFLLEATHVLAGDVDSSVCDSVVVPLRLPRGRLRDGVWLRGASTALDRRCHG